MRLWTYAAALASGLCLALGAFSAASAAEAEGNWLGTLTASGRVLHLAVHIHKGTDGTYSGTFDSLDQGARGLQLTNIQAGGDALAFDAPLIQAHYAAKWDAAANGWAGSWSQGPGSFPLNLARGEAPPAPTVEGLDGDWDGVLNVNGAKLRLTLHVKTSPAEGTIASLDSVDQNANGLPVTAIHHDGAKVDFAMTIGATFDGTLSPDGQTIAGTWTQGMLKAPLTFGRRTQGAAAPSLYRPQTPVGPFPYRQEEVAYANPVAGSVRLAGTLTLPQGRGPFPAVVLIAGSGRNARDEEIFGHKLFLVLADHLTRHGLAVLRFDKRGVGQSTGDYGKATTRDFASDVEAALAYLRGRKDIDPHRIGLIGHSEGGLIAPMVAADDHGVAFVVLMAGPGVNGTQILREQGRLILAAYGVDPKDIDAQNALRDKLFEVLRDEPPDRAQADVKRMLTDFGKAHGLPQAAMDAQASLLVSDWLRLFLTYDPADSLRKVTCPVLAIGGSKDLQVPAEESLAAIKAALAGDKDVTVRELPGLNHLFQAAQTGSPLEYGVIEQTMSPEAMDLISSWIGERVGGARGA